MAKDFVTFAQARDGDGMTYDVVVVGSGPAGLSAAVALGRALRTVLVIDAGEPRNAPAEGVHNYLTRDNESPAEFRALGRAEVERYGGRFLDGMVDTVTGQADDFTVRLADGTTVTARRVLVTSGLRDVLPDIPGLAERWGKTVLHCPYCHGYEVRGEPIGVIASTSTAMHAGLLWSQWTSDLMLFLNDSFTPDEDETRQLTGRGVRLVPGRVVAVADDGVHLADGAVVPRAHLVVQTRLEGRADFLAPLGVKPVEHPSGNATHLAAEDPSGRTAVPGLWVAGNVTDPMAQVISAAADGVGAGSMINMDLILADAG
jgi:thioredoxin reductase